MINVRDNEYSVLPNDGSDGLAALQSLVQLAPNYSSFYFPDGGYALSGPVSAGSKSFSLVGDSAGLATDGLHTGGAVLYGDFPSPIWTCLTPAKNISIQGLGFVNNHPQGGGVSVGGVGISLERLGIHAAVGIAAIASTFSVNVRACTIHWSGNSLGSVGVLSNGHSVLESLDIVGYDHGIRAWGTGVNIIGCRIEVNRYGIMLGMDSNGNNYQLLRSVVNGNSLEANDFGIWVNVVNGIGFSGNAIQGSVNSPSHQSQEGLRVRYATETTFDAMLVNGSFAVAGIKEDGITTNRVSWRGVRAENTFLGAEKWSGHYPGTPAGEWHTS